MKKNYIILVAIVLSFYSTSWAQDPTSYGNLQQGNAGNGGGNTNSFFGYLTGSINTGADNTLVGFQSGLLNTTGYENSSLGSRTLENNTTGSRNTANGVFTLFGNTIGIENTAVGYAALGFNTTGNGNTATGYQSLLNSNNSNNTAMGYQSGYGNTSGGNNSYIGVRSGYTNQTGSGNIFLGYEAGYNETGSDRLYIDNSNTSSPLIWGDFAADALQFNGSVSITDISQDDALTRILVTDNDGNVNWRNAASLGVPHNFPSYPANAGDGGGTTNSYFGTQAGIANTEVWNTFIGYRSGWVNTTGYQNTFIGSSSGYGTTTGSNNTFLGHRSGYENTTGHSNTFVGTSSGYNNTSSDYNTFIGYGTGYENTTGNYNTFLGGNSGHNNQSGIGNIFLGYRAGYNELGSNRLYIDNSDTSEPLIWGDFSNDIVSFNANVGIGTNSPSSELEIRSDSAPELHLHSTTDDDYSIIRFQDAGASTWGFLSNFPDPGKFTLHNYQNTSNAIVLDSNGNVGIGTNAPDATLAVRGDIHTQQVLVDLNGAVAPDFVFEPNYDLRTLAETERYIKENKHLPEIPSAAEMEKNGFELKEMNLKLLQKIEELTLYTIEQQKLIEEMRKEIEIIKNKK